MTFLHKQAERTGDLDAILDKVMSYKCMSFLSVHGIEVRAVFSDDIKIKNILEIKEATSIENVELGCDIIIYISKTQTTNYTDRDFKVLLTHALLKVEPTWRQDRPVLFINKESTYEVNPEVIKLFGTNNKLYKSLFDKIDDMDEPTEPDDELFRPMQDTRR